jgi:maltose/moltooligosaccharide transporter
MLQAAWKAAGENHMSSTALKPRLSLMRVLEMNLGFLGLQFSFGLQQGQMPVIYSQLGADEASIPLLSLAGPITGLLIQPIVGAMSDRTDSRWGRRTPYFLIGAVLCTIGLMWMPWSRTLWVAASLLWILDAGNNITMEPYRAYVNDRLNQDQHSIGFLSQSAFTGLAQFLALLSPSLLVYQFGWSKAVTPTQPIPEITFVAFIIGATLSIGTIFWSVMRVPELPLTDSERSKIASLPKDLLSTFREIWEATKDMPKAMRQMAWMSLFQWYGFSIYWSYVAFSIGRSIYNTTDKKSQLFVDAGLTAGQLGAIYNLIAFFAALAMVPLARRFGPKLLHMVCLTAVGLAMLYLPQITGGPQATGFMASFFNALAMPQIGQNMSLLIPAIGLGLGWASIMGNPYIILAGSIPPERTGVYMGIFNMMIVIPMIINGLTFGWIFKHLLNGDSRNALMFGGALLICAAITMIWVKDTQKSDFAVTA